MPNSTGCARSYHCLQCCATDSGMHILPCDVATKKSSQPGKDDHLTQDWLARWEKNLLGDEHNRYCDKEMGEEIGWLVSPFLNGFYEGYIATHDAKWVDHFVDWSDAWISRGIKEPDGYIGWPKQEFEKWDKRGCWREIGRAHV